MADWFEWEHAPGAFYGYNPTAIDLEHEAGFETPEEAAAADFPPRFVRIDRVRYHEDCKHAVVELLTNEEPYLYPYTAFCVRDPAGRWHELMSNN